MSLSSVFPCGAAAGPGAAERLDAALLSGEFSGYALATSNKPERVTDPVPQSLALFSRLDPSGTALAGRFRVFFAHGNDTGGPYTLAAGLAAPRRAHLRRVRPGPLSPRGQTPAGSLPGLPGAALL